MGLGERRLAQLPNVLYSGFDPTADSFHLGNLLIINSLFRSSMFGCDPIALIGGYTALYGDPSGRTSERDALSSEKIDENAESLRRQLTALWENVQQTYPTSGQLRIVNNKDWLEKMSGDEFRQMYARFRVGEMLRLGPVKARMAQNDGISFTEFMYQIFQSHDWYVLSEKYGCCFQIGGSDQLGHLDSGYNYLRKRADRYSAGLCLPLLTDEFGNKIGKSTTSDAIAVWLDPQRTSPFALYQFCKQLHDNTAERFYRYFSLRPTEQVEAVIDDHKQNLGRWIAQTALADELTRVVHGEAGLVVSQRCTRILFHGSIEDFNSVDNATIEQLFDVTSTWSLKRDACRTVGELADATRSDKNKGSKLMTTGAFKVNGKKYTDPSAHLAWEEITLKGRYSLICWGKRKFSLVIWQ